MFSGLKRSKTSKQRPTLSDLDDSDEEYDKWKPGNEEEPSEDDESSDDDDSAGKHSAGISKELFSQDQDLFGNDHFGTEGNADDQVSIDDVENQVEEETSGDRYYLEFFC